MALSLEQAKLLWSYNPETGEITCLASGAILGSISSKGYLYVTYKVDGRRKQISAGKLAWALTTGQWPVAEIDHKDTIKTNNRFSNLREATRGQNCSNRAGYSKSGAKGVFVRKKSASAKIRYIAQIKADGRQMHLGSFDTKEEASAAYAAAAKKFHGDFARC